MGSKAAERKKRLDHHFQDLSKTYLDRRCAISSQFKFDDFSNTVAKFTQYESLQVRAHRIFTKLDLRFLRLKLLYIILLNYFKQHQSLVQLILIVMPIILLLLVSQKR